MRSAFALLLASARAARRYRFRFAMSLVALAIVTIPLWYIANAMQPLMAEKIRNEGTQYFGFLLVGMVVFNLISASVSALPNAVGGAIGNGSLESLMATP